MRLEDVLRTALSEKKFFGKGKELRTFFAKPAHTVEGYPTKKIGAQVFELVDKVLLPYSFTVDDILSAEWSVRAVEKEIDNNKMHHGTVIVHSTMLQNVVELLEKKGYGAVVSYDISAETSMATMYCKSWLFSKVNDGEATPSYRLTYDEESDTLTAENISV